jgi:hypothetical protein
MELQYPAVKSHQYVVLYCVAAKFNFAGVWQ